MKPSIDGSSFTSENHSPSLETVLSALGHNGCKPTQSGAGYVAYCPVHEGDGHGHKPSLSVSAGDKVPVVIHCHAGCAPTAVFKTLGIEPDTAGKPGAGTGKRIVATYKYCDASGHVLFEKVRYEPKDFRIRHQDASGATVWKRPPDIEPPLYRLPAVLAAIAAGEPVYVTEGEKDADRLVAAGLCATTNFEGAAKGTQKAKWRDSYTAALTGADVVLLPDHDEPGTAHMRHVAAALSGKARARWLELPGLSGAKGDNDLSDWLNKGHTVDDLKALAANASPANTHRSSYFNAGADPQPAAAGPDALLVNPRTGRSLIKHNAAAERLYNLDFDQRLLFDPVELEWREYQPAKGIFKTRPALAIEQAVYRAVNRHCGGLGFDTAYIAGVTKCLMYEGIQTIQPPAGKICFQNGVLDLATMTLLPHSPDFGFTACLPFDWTPNAPDPQPIIDWLMESVDGHADQVQLLRAYIKACLVGRPDLQRFLELVGAGGSGKGTFIRLLLALLGNDAVHSTTLDQLEKNRFESAKLFGKKLVVITDADRWHGDVSMLKSITGQDPIRFEEKHKQAGASFTYAGMVLIAANQHTESTDYSSGIQRRRITVGFDHVVPAHARRDLDAEFEPYLPALAKWALDMPDADVTAYLRSTSAHVGSLRQARIDALVATNPIAAWLIDNCAFDPGATSPVGVKRKVVISSGIGDGDHGTESRVEYENSDIWLYPNYVLWCEQHGKNPLAHNVFTGALIDVGKNVLGQEVEKLRPKRDGVKVRGIRLLSEPNPASGMACDELVMNCDELVMDYPIDVVELGELSKNSVVVEKNAGNKQQSSTTDENLSEKFGDLEEKVGDRGEVHHLQRHQRLSSSQFITESITVHHRVHHSSSPPPADTLSPSPADDFTSHHSPPNPAKPTAPPVDKPGIAPRPTRCAWDRWNDRLVVKCADPSPNADRSGCANCGAVKATAARVEVAQA